MCVLTQQALTVPTQGRGLRSGPGGVAATSWHLVALAYFMGVAWGPTSGRHTGGKVTATPAELWESQAPTLKVTMGGLPGTTPLPTGDSGGMAQVVK